MNPLLENNQSAISSQPETVSNTSSKDKNDKDSGRSLNKGSNKGKGKGKPQTRDQVTKDKKPASGESNPSSAKGGKPAGEPDSAPQKKDKPPKPKGIKGNNTLARHASAYKLVVDTNGPSGTFYFSKASCTRFNTDLAINLWVEIVRDLAGLSSASRFKLYLNKNRANLAKIVQRAVEISDMIIQSSNPISTIQGIVQSQTEIALVLNAIPGEGIERVRATLQFLRFLKRIDDNPYDRRDRGELTSFINVQNELKLMQQTQRRRCADDRQGERSTYTTVAYDFYMQYVKDAVQFLLKDYTPIYSHRVKSDVGLIGIPTGAIQEDSSKTLAEKLSVLAGYRGTPYCRFSTTRELKDLTYRRLKPSDRLPKTIENTDEENLKQAYREYVNNLARPTEVPFHTTRMAVVPKNYKVGRLIGVEPIIYTYFSRIVGETIDLCLSTATDGRVNLHDQSINQKLAKEGSSTIAFTKQTYHDYNYITPKGRRPYWRLDPKPRRLAYRLCTVDQSSASDRVMVDFVREAFPQSIVTDLERYRPTHYTINGVDRPLACFATMGSRLTFPVETTVFLALEMVAVYLSLSFGDDRVSWEETLSYCGAYGDDGVIPSFAYELYVHLLTFFGFEVNQSKSFSSGSVTEEGLEDDFIFRESCGKDYMNGIDVSSTYYPRGGLKISDASSIISMIEMQHHLMEFQLYSAGRYLASVLREFIPGLTESCIGSEYMDIWAYEPEIFYSSPRSLTRRSPGTDRCLVAGEVPRVEVHSHFRYTYPKHDKVLPDILEEFLFECFLKYGPEYAVVIQNSLESEYNVKLFIPGGPTLKEDKAPLYLRPVGIVEYKG